MLHRRDFEPRMLFCTMSPLAIMGIATFYHAGCFTASFSVCFFSSIFTNLFGLTANAAHLIRYMLISLVYGAISNPTVSMAG